MSEHEKLRDEVTRLHSLIGTKDKEIERLKKEFKEKCENCSCKDREWYSY